MYRFFARVSPLFVFTIHGNSMSPLFRGGEKVLVLRFIYILIPPRIDDIVIAIDPRDGKYLLKRVHQIKNKKIFLMGDNYLESTDSRKFGMIDASALIGKIIYKL